MELHLRDQLFIVTGATKGLGRAICLSLVNEGAKVIANARNEANLLLLKEHHPDQIEILPGDITTDATLSQLMLLINKRHVSGLVVNAGGPPPKSFLNATMVDWDNAYKSLLRWKIKLTQQILGVFKKQSYGRILYIESASVKQPIRDLVLSNSLRLAVVGFVKTLSQEVAHQGITLNILAPGYHLTDRVQTLLKEKSSTEGKSIQELTDLFIKQTTVGKMGDPKDLASLATWLLSKHSNYITGQTISVDGGLIQSTFS